MNKRQQKILSAIYNGKCYLFELYELFNCKRTYIQLDKDIRVLVDLGYVTINDVNEAGVAIQFYTTINGDAMASPLPNFKR